jgi:F0F1-type ATP synthase assembly protein I
MNDFLIKLFKSNLLTIAGVMTGAMAGYLYYHYVGCINGSCSITSDPVNSTLYGAMMGGLGFNMFQSDKKEEKQ